MAIYLDNAATTCPKPEPVCMAVGQALRRGCANPGRGGHSMSLEAGRLLLETRDAVASFFGVSEASRIVFTSNATEALNKALFGLLRPGDRVVTSSMEHNSMIRPLRALQDRGVIVVKVQADERGFVHPEKIRLACAEPTKLVAITHCSNVTGTLQPIEEIIPWCRREGILTLVDAAQSAGVFDIHCEALGVDMLAAPGHKGLLGPQGTGFLYVREGLLLDPLMFGGTGSHSSSELPPEEMPERLETGTVNLPGLAGLKAGIEFLQSEGIDRVRAHEQQVLGRLIDGLRGIDGMELYGPLDPFCHGGALSFNLEGRDPSEVAFLLDRSYDICARAGLHCAPDAHRSIGTYPRGTVRLSPGYFTTIEEIDHCIAAVAAIAAHPA